MKAPPLAALRQTDTHRLIPSQYTSTGESVLTRIADNERHLSDLADLARVTNESVWGQNDRLPGIGSHELVFGVPNYRIINASFLHAHPLGSRFNSSDRGAWYAGFELETSQAEIIFHRTQEYAEIDRFDDTVFYDDYLSDSNGQFHDIRSSADFPECLAPDSYTASQQLAEQLLDAMSLGIIYPSVRRSEGTCIACFRPAAVTNVRNCDRFAFTWTGSPAPDVKRTSTVF
jgi:RES domain